VTRSDLVDPFMATRMATGAGNWGSMFGSMGSTISRADSDTIVERARLVR